MKNVEVDIDGALLICGGDAEEDVSWIDHLLEAAVKDRAAGMMRWDALVMVLLKSDELKAGSVVKSVTYLLTTRERLLLGEEAVEERMEATAYCCRDLAAAYMRNAASADVNQLKHRLEKALSTNDLSTAYQHQTDLTLSLVMRGMRNEALCSLVEEVRLSLRLGNLEGALQKVTFYRIYRAGLKVMSEVLEACSMEDFESLFKAQKKIYVNLLNFMDEEGGEEEDDVACERASATVVVSKEGERGRVGGQFRVQDLDSALRLVRQGWSHIMGCMYCIHCILFSRWYNLH